MGDARKRSLGQSASCNIHVWTLAFIPFHAPRTAMGNKIFMVFSGFTWLDKLAISSDPGSALQSHCRVSTSNNMNVVRALLDPARHFKESHFTERFVTLARSTYRTSITEVVYCSARHVLIHIRVPNPLSSSGQKTLQRFNTEKKQF